MFVDCAVLIHSTNGDLLRSLDVPDNVSRPYVVQLNREGYIVVVYDKGLLCLYGLNGRFLLRTLHPDHIQVCCLILYFFTCFTCSTCVVLLCFVILCIGKLSLFLCVVCDVESRRAIHDRGL